MTQRSTSPSKRKTILAIGVSLVVIALLFLVGFAVLMTGRGQLFGARKSADAMLFIDVPGRVALDGTLQIEGPAPVAVSVGQHTLTFFDVAASPVEVMVAKEEFQYVPNPAVSRLYYTNTSTAAIHAAAFPPDTTMEIPDCTPINSKYPVTCKSSHTLDAGLSPGTYTLKYSNPNLGEYQESFAVGSDSTIRRSHSFITTISQWEQWRQEHGDIIEQNYPRYRGHYGIGSALLLPFTITGAILGELFN